MPRSGRRAHLVSFERASVARDGYGQDIETWVELEPAWCAVYYGLGSEQRAAAMEDALQPATFECDYTATLATLSARDRVAFDAGVWDIKAMNVIGRNAGIRVTAVRQRNG